jgi:uncharacterized membrane protein YfcA
MSLLDFTFRNKLFWKISMTVYVVRVLFFDLGFWNFWILSGALFGNTLLFFLIFCVIYLFKEKGGKNEDEIKEKN